MLISISVTLLFLSFFASIVFTGYFRNIARSNNFLIDIPDKSRSFHFRPTPLIGGLSIQASILLSSLFMLSLIDYKYDFQFRGLSFTNESQENLYSEAGYSKKLSIKNENNDSAEDFRLEITPKENNNANESYVVNLGTNSIGPINITKISENAFIVSLPNGQVKTFIAKGADIVEIDPQGNKVGDSFEIISQSNQFFSFSMFVIVFVVVTLLLQLFTLLDDAYGISAGKRLFVQSIAALTVIAIGDMYIENLQLSFIGIDLKLGIWGIPFTMFAVVGIVNAFNMIDGINGLCAGFALISLGALQVASGFDVANYSLVITMGSLIGFLFYNLGFLGTKRRVFLGDNGSTFLGFMVAWTCINFSQSSESLIQPVTCLWIVAVPLLDCLGVMVGRAINGIFPFRPGRDHIHHKLQELTHDSSKTLLGLLSLGFVVACIGVLIEKSSLSSETSLVLFTIFALFFYIGSGKLLDPMKNS